MANQEKADTHVLSVTSSVNYADFGSPPLSEVYLYADTATAGLVQVDFDRSPDLTTSFPLPGKTVVRIRVNCNKVYAIAASGTTNLYILGVRLNNA